MATDDHVTKVPQVFAISFHCGGCGAKTEYPIRWAEGVGNATSGFDAG